MCNSCDHGSMPIVARSNGLHQPEKWKWARDSEDTDILVCIVTVLGMIAGCSLFVCCAAPVRHPPAQVRERLNVCYNDTLPGVVSFHRNGQGVPIPFATVVTDLARCHNTWCGHMRSIVVCSRSTARAQTNAASVVTMHRFHKEVDRCFVPTEQMKKQALNLGLKEQQLVQHGE